MLQSVQADYSLIHKNTGPRKNSIARSRVFKRTRCASECRGGETSIQHPEIFAVLCSVRCSLSQRRPVSWTTEDVKNEDTHSGGCRNILYLITQTCLKVSFVCDWFAIKETHLGFFFTLKLWFHNYFYTSLTSTREEWLLWHSAVCWLHIGLYNFGCLPSNPSWELLPLITSSVISGRSYLVIPR